ncbi:MAG TPA: hypothetical protein PLS24_05610, partial [Sedimentisphaerales bacterium]|nr:hypothetical protein [Sedimentisphaerales bacterium]
MDKIDPRHEHTRRVLRAVGIPLIFVGGTFLVVGIASFFVAFGGMGPPRFFWCAFVGMPILFAGGALTFYGFMGTVMRYSAQEMAPVGKDTFNYLAHGTK